jgi:hypothetical protein
LYSVSRRSQFRQSESLNRCKLFAKKRPQKHAEKFEEKLEEKLEENFEEKSAGATRGIFTLQLPTPQIAAAG